MAKKSNKLPKKVSVTEQKTNHEELVKPIETQVSEKEISKNRFYFWQNRTAHQWLIFFFAFLLYANAIPLEYAVDDSIVIQRNMFTKKGIKGMSGIWSKDTFVGFFGEEKNLVSGGRYRPFTVAMFAFENQLFGTVVRNNQTYMVSTNLVLDPKTKDAVLAKMGNPKHTVGEQKTELVKGKNKTTVVVNVEIESGKPLPDKDGDIVYEGNPHLSHAINGILFGLLCMLLYSWLLFVFDPNKNGNTKAVFIAFTAAVLFAAHPLHTEAVANIKGRDEIMVTLCSVLAVFWTMKSINSGRWILYLTGAVISFFIALFSKESAIPFLVIIPAAIYFFQKEVDLTTIAIRTAPFFVVVLVFWFGIRNPILNLNGIPNDDPKSENKSSKPPTELMNNPFMMLKIKANGTKEYVEWDDKEKCKDCATLKYGTILYTWLDYLRLLAVPHPLTNDYYPRHIGVDVLQSKPSMGNNITEIVNEKGKTVFLRDNFPSFKSPIVLLSMLLHLLMAALAVWGLMNRKPYAFALIFYAATFSVVSNLFFPIGTLMAERFMFMPSIAFSMLCALGLAWMATDKDKVFSLSNAKIPLAIFGIVTLLYSVKTIDRNFDWYDDYTLFTADIPVSYTSAKLNNAVSGVLQEKANKGETPTPLKDSLFKKALRNSQNAINIHPTYNNAWLLFGNANYHLGSLREAEADSLKKMGNQQGANAKYTETIKYYNDAINAFNEVNRLRPDHPDVPTNLTAAYRSRGKLFGEKLGNLPEALKNLEASNSFAKDKDVEVLRLLGVAYGISGIMSAQAGNGQEAFNNHSKAVNALEKALKIAPNYVPTIFNLEVAYREMAKLDQANIPKYLSRADELNALWKKIDPGYNPAGQQAAQQK
jgi:tetratricopeptide (TPR) repeat protein